MSTHHTETPSTTTEPVVLDIKWHVPGMPRIVGPFADEAEAVRWGGLNIPNGSWQVCPLTYPYQRATGQVTP